MMFLFHEASVGCRTNLSPGCCECQRQAVRKYSSSLRDNDKAQGSLGAFQGLLQVLENVQILVPDLLPVPERGNKFPLSSYRVHLMEAPGGTTNECSAFHMGKKILQRADTHLSTKQQMQFIY